MDWAALAAAAAGGAAGDAHVVGPWAGAAAHCAVEPTIFVGIRLGFVGIYRDFSAGECWGDVTSLGKWLGLNISNGLNYQWEQE